ncbi:MAG TPA: SDR family oxidoreductase [Nitrospirota bacterium]|nr:SDR family oxidoreductase [Nitrospirota bacterium]
MYDLKGRTALITGANQGLGLAIAHSYVKAGASVMLCARNAEKLMQAREEVASHTGAGQTVLAHATDVSVPVEVEKLVAKTLSVFPHLHILVNNAGIYGPKGCVEDIDWADWTRTIEINLFGSVLMARAVLPHFKRNGYGKIVQVSGGGATSPLPRISAYAASKAGVVRFAETLAEEVRDLHIDVNAIAPGPLNTRLLAEIIQAGPQKVGKDFYDRSINQRESGGAPLEKGAELAVFLGSSASDGITGRLISALWDPWEELPSHMDELRTLDIFTLRRIVPKDRGLQWGGKE